MPKASAAEMKTTILGEMKSKGITDLDTLVSKIIENNDQNTAAEPRVFLCTLSYCVYVRPF